MGGLTMDAAGNLYGTTYRGLRDLGNYGTVFKLSPGNKNKWTYTFVYSFDDQWQADGCGPTSRLVFDKAGNLYGTTESGGEAIWGTVYEITP
jgi:uncharacterized repeat protein (TIGR03803 family)